MSKFLDASIPKKKILIVGYGFLGFNLANFFVNQNYKVGVVTRKKIAINEINPSIIYFRSSYGLFDSVSDFCPDVVINAAGSGSPSIYDQTPGLIKNEINFFTQNLIDFWNSKKFHLIFLSSGGTIYGPNHNKPITETSNLNPVSVYGNLKKIQEKMFLENQQKYNRELLILRISNVYRVGQPVRTSHGFIEHCLASLEQKKAIKVYGSKEITRDFVHINDFLTVIKNLIDYEISNEIINIGTSIGIDLIQVVKYFNEFSGEQLSVERQPSVEEKILYNVLDNSKLKSYFNFQFTTVEQNISDYFAGKFK